LTTTSAAGADDIPTGWNTWDPRFPRALLALIGDPAVAEAFCTSL
jgi:hypothetical protein